MQTSGNKSQLTLNLTGITIKLYRRRSCFKTWISHSIGLEIHTSTEPSQALERSCSIQLDLQLKLSSCQHPIRKDTLVFSKEQITASLDFQLVASQITISQHQKELFTTLFQAQVSSSSKLTSLHPTCLPCTPQKAKIHGTFSRMISQIILEEVKQLTSKLSLYPFQQPLPMFKPQAFQTSPSIIKMVFTV